MLTMLEYAGGLNEFHAIPIGFHCKHEQYKLYVDLILQSEHTLPYGSDYVLQIEHYC